MLYFISDRDGSRCIWAQPLDPLSKRPVGEAFEVFGVHDARRSLMRRALFGDVGLSVARDKLVFSMDEISGNIWMLEPQE